MEGCDRKWRWDVGPKNGRRLEIGPTNRIEMGGGDPSQSPQYALTWISHVNDNSVILIPWEIHRVGGKLQSSGLN